MILTLTIIAGLAGVTGAASLTRYLSEVLGTDYKLAPRSRQSPSKGSRQPSRKEDTGISIAAVSGADPRVLRSLLDDAHIKLRVLRREMPGPRRSFKLIKLVESYQPELQPKGHHMKELSPVFAHVRDVVKAEASQLLAEDLQSGMAVEEKARQPLRSVATV